MKNKKYDRLVKLMKIYFKIQGRILYTKEEVAACNTATRRLFRNCNEKSWPRFNSLKHTWAGNIDNAPVNMI